MNTTLLDAGSIEKLDTNYHCHMPDNRYLLSGNYSGVIVHSQLFTTKKGGDCFIIKIRIDNTKPLFMFFVPYPMNRDHIVCKVLLEMIDSGYDLGDSDIIGEPVAFTVYNDCGYYPDSEYTKISAFAFIEAHLWEAPSA